MAITLEGTSKRTYPFGVFHNSSRSTYRQKMGSKRLKHLGMFPHEWDWEIRARYIPSCRTPTYQYNFFSTKNLLEKVLFDKMRCRRNVMSTKCRVDEMLFRENCSTKCPVDEMLFYKKLSTKLLRRNVLSATSLSTNNIAFLLSKFYFYRSNSAFSSLNQPRR